jgi:hypothetical protein
MAMICEPFRVIPRSVHASGYDVAGEAVVTENFCPHWQIQNHQGPKPRHGGGDSPLPPTVSTLHQEDIK